MEDKEKKLSDILKKVVNTGVTAAFLTEDALRGVLSDLPLPKELIQGLLQNAKSTRDDFIGGVKNELRTYLDKIDISSEIDRILENYDMEINAKIKFKKKGHAKKHSDE